MGTHTPDRYRLRAPPVVHLPARAHLPDDGHAVVQWLAGVEAGRHPVLRRQAVAAETAGEPEQARDAVGAVVLLQGPRAKRLLLQRRESGPAAGPEGRARAGEGVVVARPHPAQREASRVELAHGLKVVEHLGQPLVLAVDDARRRRRCRHAAEPAAGRGQPGPQPGGEGRVGVWVTWGGRVGGGGGAGEGGVGRVEGEVVVGHQGQDQAQEARGGG